MGSSGRGGVGGTQAAPPPECTAPPRSGGGASKPAGGEICDFASPYFPLHTAFYSVWNPPRLRPWVQLFAERWGGGRTGISSCPEVP